MSELSVVPTSLMDVTRPVRGGGGGFNFDNYARNVRLIEQVHHATAAAEHTAAASAGVAAPSFEPSSTSALSKFTIPQAKKTGTTIVGCVYNGGVVLGADTRSTNGTEVAEKNCEKIHYMAPNIYCCGAGTAADTEHTTALLASQLELLRLNTHSESRVITAMTLLKRMLYRYQGHISAALVLGGVDVTGSHLYQIYPHGSTSKLPYTTMGSGSLAAMAVFESSWHDNMTESEAVTLVERAITAGIFNDLGSGSNVDVCILKQEDRVVDFRRNAITPNEIAPLRANVQRSARLTMRPGITPILHSTFVPHPKKPTTTGGGTESAEEAMEVE